VFMVGTALFMAASLLCGLAWSGGALVGARVLQGLSAAIMAPTALSILMTTFDEGAERNKALGIWSGIAAFGATAASLVGGPLTDGLGWEWIFFLNVPVAAALLALSPVLLRESRAAGRGRALDPAGAVTVTAALVAAVYAIVEAPDAGWGSGQTLGLLAAAAALAALFVLIEARSAAPLVPLRIFRSGTLAGGNLVMLVLGMLAFGMSYVISLYAQQVLGYSALAFGLSTVIMPAMAAVGSYTGQALVTRTGFRPVAATGMVLLGAACLVLSRVSADGSYFGDIFFGLLLFGPGLGAGAVAASIAALTGVAEREAGLASGINTAAFQIGGALGVAVVSTVAVSRTAGAGGADGADPLAALTEGFRAGFTACVALAVLGLALALLLLRRPRARQIQAGDREEVPVPVRD
jgi:predicted MFS family arabinose efflux permease